MGGAFHHDKVFHHSFNRSQRRSDLYETHNRRIQKAIKDSCENHHRTRILPKVSTKRERILPIGFYRILSTGFYREDSTERILQRKRILPKEF